MIWSNAARDHPKTLHDPKPHSHIPHPNHPSLKPSDSKCSELTDLPTRWSAGQPATRASHFLATRGSANNSATPQEEVIQSYSDWGTCSAGAQSMLHWLWTRSIPIGLYVHTLSISNVTHGHRKQHVCHILLIAFPLPLPLWRDQTHTEKTLGPVCDSHHILYVAEQHISHPVPLHKSCN